MGELLVGTSGYDYREWKGVFYPENLAQSKFLEYYSTQFNSLEVNGTFYRMPSAEQMRRMMKRSVNKVIYSVKAFKDLTHNTDRSRLQPLAAEFKNALIPLLENNLLLCALFQFPESFHYEKDERLYLDLLLKEVADIPSVVELRNANWQNERVYSALRERGVGWCISDNPSLKNLPKTDFVYTGDIAYMRFHGRNRDNWYTGDNVSRYDYLYSELELAAFVEPLKQLLKNTKIVQLFFNNHAKSQATVNAKKIEMLLNERG